MAFSTPRSTPLQVSTKFSWHVCFVVVLLFTGWLNQPIWKKARVKMAEHLPPGSGSKNPKMFELPLSFMVVLLVVHPHLDAVQSVEGQHRPPEHAASSGPSFVGTSFPEDFLRCHLSFLEAFPKWNDQTTFQCAPKLLQRDIDLWQNTKQQTEKSTSLKLWLVNLPSPHVPPVETMV